MKAGFSKLDITPPVGTELQGYGYYLNRMSTSVHDPLFARALALESEGQRLLMMSCDLVALANELVEEAKAEISSRTGIAADAILIHCIHTHSGPATALMRGCGNMNPEYIDALKMNLVEVGVEAIQNLSEAEGIGYAEAESEGIGYNRTQCVAKPIDNTVRSVYINRQGKTPIALVNYACHPVASGIRSDISADYPGQLARSLGERGIECIFFNGFCGDINPTGERDYDTVAQHGERIAELVLQAKDKAVPVADTTFRFGLRRVRLPLNVPSRAELVDQLLSAKSRLQADRTNMFVLQEISWLVDAIAAIEKPDFPGYVDTYLQAFAIGDLTFIAFPGETFTAFGLELRKSFPSLRLLTANAANGMVGYIPTADEFDRRDYAAEDAARIYNTFTFMRGFGEYLCSEAAELIAQVCVG